MVVEPIQVTNNNLSVKDKLNVPKAKLHHSDSILKNPHFSLNVTSRGRVVSAIAASEIKEIVLNEDPVTKNVNGDDDVFFDYDEGEIEHMSQCHMDFDDIDVLGPKEKLTQRQRDLILNLRSLPYNSTGEDFTPKSDSMELMNMGALMFVYPEVKIITEKDLDY